MNPELYTKYFVAQKLEISAYNPLDWAGKSAPFVCIHGWLDNHGSFLPLIRQIPSLPWVAMDLIGHGKSAWRCPSSFYSFQDFVCDLALWIEIYAPPEGLHLVGHSLGASIVSIIAGLYPERVKSLVLFDGAGPLVSDPETMCEQFRRSLNQFLKPRPLRAYPSLQSLAEGRKKRHIISQETCNILAEHGHINQADGTYQWGFDPKLMGLSPFQMTDEEVSTILSHITAPTLFIRPLNGYPYPQDLMQKRLRIIKNLHYVCTPGGHHAHCDHPEESAIIIQKFYRSQGLL